MGTARFVMMTHDDVEHDLIILTVSRLRFSIHLCRMRLRAREHDVIVLKVELLRVSSASYNNCGNETLSSAHEDEANTTATRASVVRRPPSADSRVSSLHVFTHTIVFSAVLSDDPDATWTAAPA